MSSLRVALLNVIKKISAKNLCPATGGNFSAVISSEPLRILITPSGREKGELSPDHLLELDCEGQVVSGAEAPSAETALHLAIVKHCRAGAVLHSHSIWNTVLSTFYFKDGGIALEGFEMLKALSGVNTHQHREWLPIIDNGQDMKVVEENLRTALAKYPNCHGVLLQGHGLYTWGRDLQEAWRHLEVLEFLLEIKGRLFELKKD